MLKLIKASKIFIYFLLADFILFNQTRAQIVTQIVPTSCDNEGPCQLCHLWELGSNIINFIVFQLAVPIASFMILVGGIMFIISGGNSGKVSTAKTIMTNAFVGLIIALAAWLIIDTLIKSIAEGTWTGAWSDFPTSCGQ